MADFRNKKRLETRESFVRVDGGLPVGRYLVRLTVVDSDGNRSKPAQLNLEIVDGPPIRDPRPLEPVLP